MDSKSQSRNKHHKKMKRGSSSKDSGIPEVFVLPPGLLQKLGINLANVGSIQGHTGNIADKAVASIGRNVSVSQTSNTLTEESIMTTASLMKKSLMLSPTFVETTKSIPGEMEISCMTTKLSDPNHTAITEELASKRNLSWANKSLEPVMTAVASIHNGKIGKYESTTLDECPKNTGNITKDKADILNQFQPLPQVLENNSMNIIETNGDVYSHKSSSKVNILSEERIGPAKLKQIKKLCLPQLSVMTPVTKDTIISTKKSNNINNLEALIKDEPSLKLSQEIQNKGILDDSFINGNLYTEALIIANDKHGYLNNNVNYDRMEHNNHMKIEDFPMDFKFPKSHSVDDSLMDQTIGVIIQESVNCHEKSIENMNSIECHDELIPDDNIVNGYNLDTVIVDCNISNNETPDVTIDVYSTSDTGCASKATITLKREYSDVDLIGEGNANMNCKEYSNSIKHPVQEEVYAQVKEKNNMNNILNGLVLNPTEKTLKVNFIENNSIIEHNNVAEYEDSHKCLKNMQEDVPKSNINNNKISDITMDFKPISFDNHTKNKQEIIRLSGDNIDKISKDENYDAMQSKLCIQGVEKPGGIDEIKGVIKRNRVLKAYQNRNKCLRSHLALSAVEISSILDKPEEEINIGPVSMTTKVKKYCVCEDFGKLKFYAVDDVYEHLHFWQHKNTNCDIELIFSIYHDDDNNYKKPTCDESIPDNEEIEDSDDICWNNFQHAEKGDEMYCSSSQKILCSNKAEEVSTNENLRTNNLGVSATPVGDEQGEDESNREIAAELSRKEFIQLSDDNEELPLIMMKKSLSDTTERIDNAACKEDNLNNLPIKHTNKDAAKEDTALQFVQSTELVNAEMCVDKKANKKTYSKKDRNEEKCPEVSITPAENGVSPPDPINKRDRLSKSKATTEEMEVQSLGSQLPEESQKVNDDGGGSKEPNKKNEQENTGRRPSQTKLNKQDTTSTPNVKNKRGRPAKRRFVEVEISTQIKEEPEAKKQTKCGVCNLLVSEQQWENHIISQHQFVAWKAGDTLDLDDADLRKKLHQSLKITGFLKCTFCSKEIACLRKFITHVKSCMNLAVSEVKNMKCGVCKTDISISEWHDHIGKQHNYLAWAEGESPLNLLDSDAVRQHLQILVRQYGVLTCFKCGAVRKRVSAYQTHMETCTVNEESLNDNSFVIDLAHSIKAEVVDDSEQSSQENSVTCAVCQKTLPRSQWMDHISKEHNYLAWPVGTKPLDLHDQEQVKLHLMEIIRWHGGLTCANCGLLRKRANMYLNHVKTCEGDSKLGLDTSKATTSSDEEKIVTCAVCKQTMSSVDWFTHISTEHNYLAWHEGSPPIDMNNEIGVRIYLTTVGKENGGLVCHKCGETFKYAISYLNHIKEPCEVTLNESNLNTTTDCNLSQITGDMVKCGACGKEVPKGAWFDHTQEHEYRAWIDGREAPDFKNQEVLHKFLTNVAKAANGLKCFKCGLVRKYAKTYLQHMQECQNQACETSTPSENLEEDVKSDAELVECGMCHKRLDYSRWKKHAMQEHYNIAWIVGDTPIDLNNPYQVEIYLKKYQLGHKNMTCKICGISRVSRVGFYAHILICGKSDEEKDKFQSFCKICKKKYLIIYHNQHMTAHREAELARERKLLVEQDKQKKRLEEEVEKNSFPLGRRKAAENAQKVIKKYEMEMQEGKHKCQKCGFTSDVESQQKHKCVPKNVAGYKSDSDESVKLEHLSEHESVDTDIDSDISGDETFQRPTPKRPSDSNAVTKVQRFPYSIETPRLYLNECGKEFVQMHLSEGDLFMQWRTCEYEPVVEDLEKYLPSVEESCEVKYKGKSAAIRCTFKRFEGTIDAFHLNNSLILFTSGSVQCVSWIPARSEENTTEPNFLSVVTHLGPDLPRHEWDQTATGPGLIQIWDCADLGTCPEFVLGIAHDYGTVWSTSWCPSGVRDECDEQDARLGLLAAACSNGSVYIFAVPYPSTIVESEKRFYKLKPVAELRMVMGSSRKTYQATAVKWTPRKGHSHVVVGYSDGSIGYYDLNTKSPILRSTENNVAILHPYYDEKFLKHCVEDVDVFPTLAEGAGAVAGSSVSGSAACRGAARGGSLSSSTAVAHARFQPHWPSVMLSGDEAMCSSGMNELEWCGAGRRFGGARGTAACSRCGRLAVATLPLLRTMRAPPHYPELHKQVVALIEISPLNNKKTKKQNDDISMVVEPITYEDAVKKYGISYEPVTDTSKTIQKKLLSPARPPYPERFPLADITSMEFCPTLTNHDRLAVGLHAGFVFLMTV